ncbi:MAG: hypothetical protein HOV81_28745 [Kofleriaceae bacterium]|nr:hypothetical protein [Kofleriaceae bacterium]
MKCLVFALLALGACTPDVDQLPVEPNNTPSAFVGVVPGTVDAAVVFADAGIPGFDGGVRGDAFLRDAGLSLFDATFYGDVGQNPYDAAPIGLDAGVPPFP